MPKDVVVVYGCVSAPWSMFAGAASTFAKHSSSCCAKLVAELPRDQMRVLIDFSNRIRDIEELREAQRCRRLGRDSLDMRNGLALHAVMERTTLLRLLQRFRDRRASDPRDKVYALLSLVDDGPEGAPLVPDYSLSEREVFIKATLEIIRTSESLSVLNNDIGRKSRNDLPSWVPDWDSPIGQTNEVRVGAMELYNAPTSSQGFMIPFKGLQSPLEVRAMEISHVVKVEEVMWGDSASICRQTLRNWWQAVNNRKERRYAMTQPISDFWRLLCADAICFQPNLPGQVRRATAEDGLDFLKWTEISERSPFPRSESNETTRERLRSINGYRTVRPLILDYYASKHDMWSDALLSPRESVWKTLSRAGLTPHQMGASPNSAQNILRLHYTDLFDQALVFERALDALYTRRSSKITWFIDWITGLAKLDAPWNVFFDDACEYLNKNFEQTCPNRMGHLEDRVAAMDSSIMAATLSRRLFLTGNDYMGLGPADTEQGDSLFFVDGGKTPFVLRQVAGNTYHVVGDCYLQGLMDAGLVPSMLRGETWETIELV
ncbi:hypothetical protein K491DRAFT_726445 [Lophiostoma macrostomum CBS 122681]|uniref:Heterokaryon incompatibility domain-containing protein n=1 Tax=Lophiostoma macrostomum CBS 122681 TaxID=1314788 RepID=A0A6A6SYK6_9PLEO|nr:hypothetical protein K491DRAFT_726445 [Lophiostoma macrostomum CBS 122681]